MRRPLLLLLVALCPLTGFAGCSGQPSTPDLGPSTFAVLISSVNGSPMLPTVQSPLPANHGTTNESWGFTIQATTPTGEPATDFNGYVRLTLVPGTVVAVTSTTNTYSGRNILLQGGQASGVIQGTGVYGPARLWVEDLGYVPVSSGVAQCSNGVDDNHNGLIDYPADPGCYYADDDTEDGGTYSAGVSPAVEYALPLISDVRGAIPGPTPTCSTSASCGANQTCNAGGQCTCGTTADCVSGVCAGDVCIAALTGGARTPYPNEGIQIAASDPEYLVVTRVASSGFYVTDVGPKAVARGYNSLYAFNFSTPVNLQVCDRITSLSGTTTDFYGFTQLGFPSFTNTYTILAADAGPIDAGVGLPGCQVPDPTVLVPSWLYNGSKNTSAMALYPYEAGLVRLEGFTIAKNFGPMLATNQNFKHGQSSCDFNGDGMIDYTTSEGTCANACDNDPDCSEYTAFTSRSQYKVANGGFMIEVNSSTVATFDPVGNAGLTIPHITGTLTEFSGGSLNWTVEVRCADDLVCPAALGCATQQTIPSTAACVSPRTASDNDEGSN